MSDSEEELQDIINKFNLINFQVIPNNDNQRPNFDLPNNNMANPNPINYPLLRLYVDTIPPYDGDPHTLTIFINNCTCLINNFHRDNDNTHNSFIVRAIIGKLSGRALSLIGSRINELKTWNDVKFALELSFGDQRNLDCLVQDLITLSPNKNETPYNFGMRCQDARSLIFSKLNSLNLAQNELDVKTQNYDDLALKTFIRGLSGQLQNNIRLRNPINLEKAMSLVIEEENFLYSQSRNNLLNLQNFKLNQRVTPVNNNNNNNYPRNKTINYQNNQQSNPFIPRPVFNNNYRPFGFQPRPNTFQPRPNTFQPVYPQQRPNFQRPFFSGQRPSQIIRNNQFRPTFNNPNQNRPKPEPMDTSSGNTIINNQGQQPRYTFTELHQQNIENNPYESNQYLDYQNTSYADNFDYSYQNDDNQNFDYYDQYSFDNSYYPYEEMSYNNYNPYAEQNNANNLQQHQPTEIPSFNTSHTNAQEENNELNFQIVTSNNKVT